MATLLEMLQSKTEDEAIEKLKILAAPPVSITLVCTADGGMAITTTGGPSADLVPSLLLEAAKVILTKKNEKNPS